MASSCVAPYARRALQTSRQIQQYPKASSLSAISRSSTSSLSSSLTTSPRAQYHSYEHPDPPPYRAAESAILTSALQHVPALGFTHEALVHGAKDAGYLDISTNLFPRGGSGFELVKFHLVTQRLALKHRVQFPGLAANVRDSPASAAAAAGQAPSQPEPLSISQKVRALTLARLHANTDAPNIFPRYQEALGLMSLAENIPASLRELAALSDEIWFLAGDTAVDSSWYTKRASLSAVYASAEAYMTTDQSEGFRDTEAFLDRRLEDVRGVGSVVGGFAQWATFQAGSVVNAARSKGVRI